MSTTHSSQMTSESGGLAIALVGSPAFVRASYSKIQSQLANNKIVTGSYGEIWGLLTSARPDLLVIEIGAGYDDRTHRHISSVLQKLRSRTDRPPYTAIALTSSDRFFYGGDLLFLTPDGQEKDDLKGVVHSFLAQPPSNLPHLPDVAQQLVNLVETLTGAQRERVRDSVRGSSTSEPPYLANLFPSLNSPGWVQSMADPQSRDLWLKWLPRYARYLNESPLIVGQTGTGKTNLAYALHLLSGRAGKFVSITPRDFSSSELVQAEMFGSVAGAYTGAVDKWGLVKSAERGTLFIDELQSIDKDLQGKLITFIENKSYRRVGSSESVSADVRFIFATNQPLPELLEKGVLRDDFAYRLERVQLELKPLADRKLDIAAALAYALAKIHRQRPQPDPIIGLTQAAYRLLLAYPWPGNLRQLENGVAKLCERADMQGKVIIDDLAVREITGAMLMGSAHSKPAVLARAAIEVAKFAVGDEQVSLHSCIDKLTERTFELAVESTGGDLAAAAELIGESPDLVQLYSERDRR